MIDGGRNCIRTSVTLTWAPPESVEGSPITRFTVQQKTKDTESRTIGHTGGDLLTYRVDGLLPRSDVQFNVVATNAVGASPAGPNSPIYSVIDRPGQPKKPWIKDADGNSCVLRWAPPDNNGGCQISEYLIQKRQNHGDWKLTSKMKVTTGQALSMKISNLETGARVTFRVIAVNWIGESFPSAASPLCSISAAPSGTSSSSSQRGVITSPSSPPPPFQAASCLLPQSSLMPANSCQPSSTASPSSLVIEDFQDDS